jgi:hypothetical protein
MKKIAGSGSTSGSISQKHGSADSDPHQNDMDTQHWANARIPVLNSVWPSRARAEYGMICTVMEAANGLPYWLLCQSHFRGQLLEYRICTHSQLRWAIQVSNFVDPCIQSLWVYTKDI